MLKHLPLLVFLFFFGIINSNAQKKLTRNCAAETVHLEKLENDPHYRNSYLRVQEKTSRNLRRNGSNYSTSGIRVIPVYVHIIYNESNPEENISTAQIESQISVINEDFRALNPDISSVPSEFAGVVSDYQIEFELLNITRTSSTRTQWGTNDDMKKSAEGGVDPISPDTHLNIWVCEIGGGILGYAQFPGGSATTDGVVVGPKFFGDSDQDDGSFFLQSPFDKGRTLTHEIGHYLNLRHIWGDGDCLADDFVDDTPIAGASNNGCPTYPSKSCTENTDFTSDMFMNYMDYVDDNCMFMFSEGQKARTLSIFEAGGARENLGSIQDGCDLAAPLNLQSANISDTGFDLTWDLVTGASEYEIFYNNSSVYSTSNSTSISGLNPGTQTDVRVRALCTQGGTGVFSDVLQLTTTGCPEGPATLTILADDYGEDIGWNLNLDGVEVASGGPYTSNSTTTININHGDGNYVLEMTDSFGDGICCDYGSGSYTVTDYNGNIIATGGDYGNGETTNFCLGNTATNIDTEAPSTPSNLLVSDINESSAYLDWDASTDNIAVTGYEIYLNTVLIDTSAVTNYNLVNLNSATEYTIEIIAIDETGNQSGALNNVFNTQQAAIDCSNSIEALLGSPNAILEANPNSSYFFDYTMPESGILSIQIQVPNDLIGSIRVYDNGDCQNLVDEVNNSDNLTTSEFEQGELIYIEFEFNNIANNTQVDWDFQIESTQIDLNPACADAPVIAEGLNYIDNYTTDSSYFFIYEMPGDGSLHIETQNEIMADVNLYLDNCNNEDLIGTKIEGFGSGVFLETVEFQEGTTLVVEWIFTETNYTTFEWELLYNPRELGNQDCYDGLQAYVGNSNFIPNVQPNTSYFYYYSPGNVYSNNFRLSIEALTQIEGVNLKLHYQMNCQGDDIDSTNTGYLLSKEVESSLHHIEWEFTEEYTNTHFEWTFDEVLSADLATQNITFNELPVLTYGHSDLSLDASASSGLNVTYQSSNPDVAVVNNGQISIIGAGTASITAFQNGNANEGYLPATPVERSLVVEKATLNAIPQDIKITYGDEVPDFTINYSNFITDDNISDITTYPTTSTLATSESSVGTYDINLTGGVADNYVFNFSTGTLTIEKANQIIVVENISDKSVFDEDFEVIASATNGLALDYKIVSGPATIQGNIISIEGNAGTVMLEVSQAGNENYNEAFKTISFEVLKADQVITVENISDKSVFDGDFDVIASSTSGLDLDYNILSGPASIQGNTISLEDMVGTVELEVSQQGNDNYNQASKTISFEVLKADQVITVENISDKSVFDGDFDVIASSTSGLDLDYNILSGPASIQGNTISLEDIVGTVELEVSQQGNDNYNQASETISFEVLKANQEITFEPLESKVYGAEPFTLNATVSSDLMIEYVSSDENIVTINDNIVNILGAGTVDITAYQSGSDIYNAAEEVVQTLEIVKANQEIEFENISDKNANEDSFEVFASSTSNLELEYEILDGPATISENIISLTGEFGNVELQISQAGNENYNPANVINSFEVLDPCANFYASAEDLNNILCYGESNGSFSINIESGTEPYEYILNGEVFSENTFTNMSAGEYIVTVKDANNCSTEIPVVLNEPDSIIATAEIQPNSSSNGNGSIILSVSGGSGNYTINWTNNKNGDEINGLLVGDYTATIVDENGCSLIKSFTVGGINSSSNLHNEDFKLFPNPTNKFLKITYPDSFNDKKIRVYDTKGAIIKEIKSGMGETTINTSELTKGLYFIQFNNNAFKLRFVKQ